MTDPALMPPAPTKADEPGVIDDLVDIFTTPAKVFARRAKGGGGAVFFAVALLLGGVLFMGKNVMEPIMEAQMRKGMAAAAAGGGPAPTAEQLEAGMNFQRKLMPFILILGAPLALCGVGVLVWVGAKSFGAEITFGTSMVIAALAYIPRIIGGVITTVQGLMMSDVSTLTDPSQVSVSPARFLDVATASPYVLAILTRFDVFTIWVTVLIGIAYFAAGKVTKEKAIAGASLVWLIGTLWVLWGASRVA